MTILTVIITVFLTPILNWLFLSLTDCMIPPILPDTENSTGEGLLL